MCGAAAWNHYLSCEAVVYSSPLSYFIKQLLVTFRKPPIEPFPGMVFMTYVRIITFWQQRKKQCSKTIKINAYHGEKKKTYEVVLTTPGKGKCGVYVDEEKLPHIRKRNQL